jgi:YVTN family beta-propeller protein
MARLPDEGSMYRTTGVGSRGGGDDSVKTRASPDHFALSPDGRFLYVSIYSEAVAAVIDTETREITGRFATGPLPHGMRVSADGKRVFNGTLAADRLTIADARTFEILTTIEFDQGVRPFTFTRDGKKLYAQLSRFHGFIEVDLDSSRVTKSVYLPVPEGVTHQKRYPHTAHHGLELTPDERYLCAAATVADYVAIVSHPGLELLATIPVGKQPSWIITSLDGKHCHVSSRVGDTVSVISVEDRKEIKRIPVGDYPQRMWTVRVPSRRVSTSGAP